VNISWMCGMFRGDQRIQIQSQLELLSLQGLVESINLKGDLVVFQAHSGGMWYHRK